MTEDLIERHRRTCYLIRAIDVNSREARKHLSFGPSYDIWVKVSAKFACRAAFELYPELRESL